MAGRIQTHHPVKLSEIKDAKLREKILQADRQQNPRPVRALEANGTEPAPARALDRRGTKHQGGAGGVAVRITCIALRRRLVDRHDGVAFACKPLTDAIAKTLGVDDADPRLDWEYGQVVTRGKQGVLVKVEIVENRC